MTYRRQILKATRGIFGKAIERTLLTDNIIFNYLDELARNGQMFFATRCLSDKFCIPPHRASELFLAWRIVCRKRERRSHHGNA